MNRNLKQVLDHQLSTLTWDEADTRAVMNRLKGEEPIVKRKISMTLVFALAALLALASAAVAAGLGAFSTFARPENAARLERLDAAAQDVGKSAAVSAPALTNSPEEPGTLYDEIMAYQDDYAFTLTLDKAYSDGQKLYYAYTLCMNRAPKTTFFEGKPSGFDTWAITHTDPDIPGSHKLMNCVSMYEEAEDAAFRAWFDPREEAYAVRDYVGVGDGCRLADGRVCSVYDDGSVWVDETTLSGFAEVLLPEDAVKDGQIDFVLSIGFGTAVYYQNAEGAYSSNLSLPWPENSIKVPMRCTVNGNAAQMTGSYIGSGFTASAQMTVSDVEIFGAVTLTSPSDAAAGILDYALITPDGAALPNLDGALEPLENGVRIHLRYDLPPSLEALALRPHGAGDGHPDIPLR